MLSSGEFHPWRLPSIPLWRDVLEKMKVSLTILSFCFSDRVGVGGRFQCRVDLSALGNYRGKTRRVEFRRTPERNNVPRSCEIGRYTRHRPPWTVSLFFFFFSFPSSHVHSRLSNRYINAETSGGGFPGWLTNFADAARSNGTEFTAAWKPYIEAVSQFITPYQYPDGPVILVQSENEFSMSDPSVSEDFLEQERVLIRGVAG